MHKCTNVQKKSQMLKCTNGQMLKCTNAQMDKCSFECTNEYLNPMQWKQKRKVNEKFTFCNFTAAMPCRDCALGEIVHESANAKCQMPNAKRQMLNARMPTHAQRSDASNHIHLSGMSMPNAQMHEYSNTPPVVLNAKTWQMHKINAVMSVTKPTQKLSQMHNINAQINIGHKNQLEKERKNHVPQTQHTLTFA